MGSKTNYLENALLDHVLRHVAYTSPTTIYVGLFTVAPGEDGGGTELSTIGTGYIRKSSTFGSALDGYTSNINTLTFGPATTSWGTIRAFGLFDSESDGYLLYYTTAAAEKTIETDDKIEIPVGGIVVNED